MMFFGGTLSCFWDGCVVLPVLVLLVLVLPLVSSLVPEPLVLVSLLASSLVLAPLVLVSLVLASLVLVSPLDLDEDLEDLVQDVERLGEEVVDLVQDVECLGEEAVYRSGLAELVLVCHPAFRCRLPSSIPYWNRHHHLHHYRLVHRLRSLAW
jgi:hypothetical protein